MKIALIGGHLTPALAVIDALPKEAEIVFIGRKHTMEGDTTVSLEYKTITARGIHFSPLTTGRIQRNIGKHTLTSFFKLPYGLFQAISILKTLRPGVVVGFGGYVSVPVCIAAYILKIPVVIHEQTLEAGLANKLIGKIATRICISWPQSALFFPKQKTVVTGNPLRKFSSSLSHFSLPHKHLPLLYVTGGSAGAHAINLLIEENLEKLLQHFGIIHQTGAATLYNDFERLSRKRNHMSPSLQARYHLTQFVDPAEVGGIMREADLVVSRSGMNTVTELLYFGKPCLLIPLLYGQRNEQLKNAQFIKKVGIGTYVLQPDLTPESFYRHVLSMIEQRAKYVAHASAAKQLVHSDAAEHIIKIVYEVIQTNQSKAKTLH